MKISKLLLTVVICSLFLVPFKTHAQEHKPYVGSEAYERMKQLVGQWEGTMNMENETKKINASYKLTSADSAIVETIFAGTPMEMVSIYHDPNRKLTMTHYCAEGNQPKLVLTQMENGKLTLDLARDSEIDVAHETHMHTASIQFEGKNKMTQQWTQFKEGKKGHVVEITYTRIK